MDRAKQKIRYFFSSASKWGRRDRLACPSCGCARSSIEDRKKVVTSLRRCAQCRLLFRTPTTTAEESARFYEEDYSQGFTTDMPDRGELEALTAQAFAGTEKDYTTYVAVLEALGCRAGSRVLDFGCSWGYGSWQLAEAGYRVEAFEISTTRCAYARKELAVDAHDTLSELRGPYNVFFSAHVLEHVPSVADVIAFAQRVLAPEGLFVAFTPNASRPFREANPSAWHQSWGLVHPQILDDVFYEQAFDSSPYLLASAPYDLENIGSWSGMKPRKLGMSGPELLAAAPARSLRPSPT
jgi:2-polyprenyl-3-methyl-5-hydroxy-6-metoxy-1,4-benzoquinol methylase